MLLLSVPTHWKVHSERHKNSSFISAMVKKHSKAQVITTYCALPVSQAEKNLWLIASRTVLPFLAYSMSILASSG
jgi:hypothetical protein